MMALFPHFRRRLALAICPEIDAEIEGLRHRASRLAWLADELAHLRHERSGEISLEIGAGPLAGVCEALQARKEIAIWAARIERHRNRDGNHSGLEDAETSLDQIKAFGCGHEFPSGVVGATEGKVSPDPCKEKVPAGRGELSIEGDQSKKPGAA
ncbi:MAG: hypothetical protein R3D60_13055 [Paracoccaceae bacterium]